MTRALVNGLSPQIVFPGSKLTIRGENLGEDIDDIISNSFSFEMDRLFCFLNLDYLNDSQKSD